jgi:phosphoglycolate phosphatase
MVRTLRAIPSSSIRLLVFDLDGTLIDSSADLCASVNATLRHFGRQSLSESVITSYVGSGAPLLLSRAFGEATAASLLDAALTYFLEYYGAHKLDQTSVYPGVFEALNALTTDENGSERAMYVLTNKPVGASQGICDALGLSPYFSGVYGGNSFETKKPDPQGLNQIIREAGVAAQETVMVGDSGIDISTARNAGAWSIGCSYGLDPKGLAITQPDSTVDSASELPLVLDGDRAGVLNNPHSGSSGNAA